MLRMQAKKLGIGHGTRLAIYYYSRIWPARLDNHRNVYMWQFGNSPLGAHDWRTKDFVFCCIYIAPVNCGDPGIPANGWRLVHGTTEPSTVEYSCVEGYALNGTSERTCMSSGEWSDALPQCQSKYITLRPSIFSLPHPRGGAVECNTLI